MDTNASIARFEAFFEWLVPQQGAWRDATLNDVAVTLSVASGELTMTFKAFGHDMEVVNYWAGYEAAVRVVASVRTAGFPEVAEELEALAKLFHESIDVWKV